MDFNEIEHRSLVHRNAAEKPLLLRGSKGADTGLMLAYGQHHLKGSTLKRIALKFGAESLRRLPSLALRARRRARHCHRLSGRPQFAKFIKRNLKTNSCLCKF